jgi:TolB-like protein/tetratricopeptide (TPR) repeat protein
VKTSVADTPPLESPGLTRDRLESWKEIAVYLKRDERTVRRWEKDEGLPVHRHVHKKSASVYAFPAEIDGWWAGRRAALEGPAPAATPVRRYWRAGAAAAGVIAVALGAFAAWRSDSRPARERRAVLAVLPFENLTGDAEQEYLSDGLTEEMIAQVSRSNPDGLGVIARTSAMRYKGTRKGVDEIGRELGVDYVLEGSMRKERERLRITAQLIRVSDQTHLWAESYDGTTADILSLQADVARRIVRDIGGLAETAAAPSTAPVNPEAYGAYLKARYYAGKAQYWSTAKAVAHYREAIAADPGFAPAYAGLAESSTFDYPTRETMPRAKAAALKALELDPRLAEAHAALGLVHTFWEWDWAAADRSFQRALALNAGNAEIHQYYSQHLSAAGRRDEALEQAQRALTMDPLSPRLSGQYARVLYLARRYDEAIAQHRKTLALEPNDYWAWFFMGIAYENKGLHREAIEAIVKSQEIQGYKPLAASLQEGYRRAGYEGALQAWVANWEEGARQGRQVQWVSVAMLYARLGDKEKALAALGKAYEERSRALAYIAVEPQLDALRSEPRFQEMVRRIVGSDSPAS